MTKLIPLKSEDIAKLDLKQSMYIEASAGTGKTYTIQQIVARMIQQGTPLSHILLVTYTEKAAGELKDRIRNKLDEVLRDERLIPGIEPKLSPEILGLFDTAKREIDGAQIFTIHSFCQKTLRTYAYDAWRPFEMQLIDDKLVKNLIARKIRDVWPADPDYQRLLKGSSDDSSDASESGQDSKLDSTLEDIEKILVSAVPRYFLDQEGNEHPEIIERTEPDCLTENDKKYGSPNTLSDLLSNDEFVKIYRIISKAEYQSYKANKGGTKTIADLKSSVESWHKGKKLVSNSSFKEYSNDWNWPEDLISAYTILRSWSDNLDEYSKFNYAKNLSAYLLNFFLCKELPKLYQEWRKEKAENKYESYQDMIHVVHQAIAIDKDNTLTEQLRKDYQYAIIDEFQDTNRLQWDIFSKIFLGDKAHPAENHSLFVVGDPKQSIYAFQGADIDVYREAIKTIGNGRRLNTNYRSTNDIIEACNCLFKTEEGSEFFTSDELIFSESECPPADKAKLKTLYKGDETKPVWISRQDISQYDFASFAAEKIVDCCTKEDGHTRLQIFDKDNPGARRDVRFSDFAILLRTKTEFPPIENALKKLGIPFVRYKDAKLFDSRECMQWIALFRAIDADDFSAYNRRLLNEALMTDFFLPRAPDKQIEASDKRSLISKPNKFYSVSSRYYDDPTCNERRQLAEYHALARKFRWAELLECIYRNSAIETRTACDLSKLQSLAKFQQIGNYCIEYLYAHRCCIQDLVKHLDNLQNNEEGTSDQDGNLVARNTDFNAVQLMTIHASKGLEFPIVIGCAGFKTLFTGDGPYEYHVKVGDKSFKKLSFSKTDKINDDDIKTVEAAVEQETIEEWKRLFYVAYTRASALLMLPRYRKICDVFLKNSIARFTDHPEHCKCFDDWEPPKFVRLNELKEQVLTILQGSNAIPSDVSNREVIIKDLESQIVQKSLIQHSYSSLAAKDEHQRIEPPHVAVDANGRTTDFAGESDETDDLPYKDAPQYILESKVDPKGKHISVLLKDGYRTDRVMSVDADYPKGRQLGNAIHEVFEKIDFAGARKSFERFRNDPDIVMLIEQTYSKYGIPINQHDNWLHTTAQIVWNTLNAKLPEIPEIGEFSSRKTNEITNDHYITGECFSLNDKSIDGAHLPEVEFMLSGMQDSDRTKDSAEYFFKGFMDLLFVRTINGKKRYSILDWKSDRMPETDFSNPLAIQEKVDIEYSVQRVLYSYCLIEWLKQFYARLSPSESDDDYGERLFKDHFGGIYYAFVRGCCAETSNGIYAQTWKSYAALQSCYHKLKGLMYKQASKEKHDDG